MAKLSPRVAGFIRQHLAEGKGEDWVTEEVIRQTGADRGAVRSFVARVAAAAHARLAKGYLTHVWIGGLLVAAAGGLLVATTLSEGSRLVVLWWGGIVAGVADASYGYFGWRRCRSAIRAKG